MSGVPIRRAAFVAVAAGVLSLSAGDAWAQARPYRDNGRLYKGSEAMLRKTIVRISDCAVKQQYRFAKAFIVNDYSIANIDNYSRRFFNRSCIVNAVDGGVRLSTPSHMIRYAIAEALVKRDLATVDLPDLSAVQPLAHPSLSDLRTGDKISIAELHRRAELSLSPYSECVVRTDWKLARDLLRSRVESSDEMDAFRRLGRTLNSCAPKGVKFQLNKSWVRGAIANSYYRLAAAAGVVSSQ